VSIMNIYAKRLSENMKKALTTVGIILIIGSLLNGCKDGATLIPLVRGWE